MPDYTLYSYFRSSCTARVRIALHLKGVSYEDITVNLLKGEQRSDAHLALNPSGTVPLLICHAAAGMRINQSLPAVEYIDEVHTDAPSLLPPPSDPAARAAARSLASIVAADIQPVTNLVVRQYVKEISDEAHAADWMTRATLKGLQAYEEVASKWAGRYSVGDELTVADCCLVPAVWNAQRLEIDVASRFPTIARVMKNLEEVPAVKESSYFRQKDCPPELRAKD